ncbi:MAG: hypothetical protein IJM23_05760 [Lachnospiraceae bacterium]|nr:hypothetical protein [Lachnospiraceae bacterium]
MVEFIEFVKQQYDWAEKTTLKSQAILDVKRRLTEYLNLVFGDINDSIWPGYGESIVYNGFFLKPHINNDGITSVSLSEGSNNGADIDEQYSPIWSYNKLRNEILLLHKIILDTEDKISDIEEHLQKSPTSHMIKYEGKEFKRKTLEAKLRRRNDELRSLKKRIANLRNMYAEFYTDDLWPDTPGSYSYEPIALFEDFLLQEEYDLYSFLMKNIPKLNTKKGKLLQERKWWILSKEKQKELARFVDNFIHTEKWSFMFVTRQTIIERIILPHEYLLRKYIEELWSSGIFLFSKRTHGITHCLPPIDLSLDYTDFSEISDDPLINELSKSYHKLIYQLKNTADLFDQLVERDYPSPSLDSLFVDIGIDLQNKS